MAAVQMIATIVTFFYSSDILLMALVKGLYEANANKHNHELLRALKCYLVGFQGMTCISVLVLQLHIATGLHTIPASCVPVHLWGGGSPSKVYFYHLVTLE